MGDAKPAKRDKQSTKQKLRYQRVLLKISGEALQGDQGYGISPTVLDTVAAELKEVHALGIELALVIGGGNIFRGLQASASGMDRVSADYMGMLATVMNALALQDALERHGVPTRVLSAIEMAALAEPYIRRRAIRHLQKGRVVIFGAGTGNPFFTTDTAAALRSMEISAEVMLKATKVDGVYSADPVEVPDAKLYRRLYYLDVLSRELKVMDATAVSLCMDNAMPLIVFNLQKRGNIKRAVLGGQVGTLIRSKPPGRAARGSGAK